MGLNEAQHVGTAVSNRAAKLNEGAAAAMKALGLQCANRLSAELGGLNLRQQLVEWCNIL